MQVYTSHVALFTCVVHQSVLYGLRQEKIRPNAKVCFRWTVKHDLRIPRCYCNLVCSNNRMYVFGGAAEVNNMLQSISSVDLYDPRSDSWEHVANLKTARHNSGSAVIGETLNIIPEC